MEILCPLYSIQDDQGHATGAMRVENRTSEMGDIGVDAGYSA